MKKFYFVLLALSALLLTQCEVYREGCTDPKASNYEVAADINDGSCEYIIDPTSLICEPSAEGNLLITNETDEVLLLYVDVVDGSNDDYEPISCIPANAENFVVYVPTDGLGISTLQIWKAINVDNDAHPQLLSVYRQWSIALAGNTIEAERANWLITDNADDKSSGTLLLSYPEIDEYNQEVIYQVDVFLNSQNGSRVASLQPGTNNKIASVDYGVHYLYFKYWYSDPNTSTGEITEIGWNEMANIVINAEHQSSYIDIPIFESAVGKYGYLKVYNTTDNPISIYANDQLIESIAKIDGSSEGLSIIPAQNSTRFVIPEGNYTISAKSFDGSTNITSFKGVDIIASDTAFRSVGPKMQEISVINNTSEKLMLYSVDGNYLGKLIDAGSSSGTYLVNADYDSLMVISVDKTQKMTIAAGTGVEVSTLEDFFSQKLTITEEWNQLSINYYTSPDIGDDESTSMIATLMNNTQVLLSFEYRVSSEYDYDKFSFFIDDVNKIDNESGATEWRNYSTYVSPGNHELRWTYTKDGMFSVGNDNVEIKNISIE